MVSSDLRHAVETAEIAFGDTGMPIRYDWRLRECDFGERNGSPAAEVRRDRLDFCDRPYPGGESHRQAIARVARGAARASLGDIVADITQRSGMVTRAFGIVVPVD